MIREISLESLGDISRLILINYCYKGNAKF